MSTRIVRQWQIPCTGCLGKTTVPHNGGYYTARVPCPVCHGSGTTWMAEEVHLELPEGALGAFDPTDHYGAVTREERAFTDQPKKESPS